MAKMMMGQIDHARQRVRDLRAAKLGDYPKAPDIKNGDCLIQELREETIKLKNGEITMGFYRFIHKTPSETVIKESGNYQNGYTTSYEVASRKPTTIEDGIADAVYKKHNEQALKEWKKTMELYELRKEAIALKATEVEDAIVLGDQVLALAALQEFSEFQV